MTNRFMTVLEEASVRPIDQWEYIGGDSGKHAFRFFEIHGCTPNIPKEEECVCSKAITDNCYIKNMITGKILVVGPCCIKPFTHKKCSSCGCCHMQKSSMCRPCKIKSEYDILGGRTIIRAGKHRGKTFKRVLRRDAEYCAQILRDNQTDTSLILFKKWLNR